MKHPRAELIAKWLEDTTQPIWFFAKDMGKWYLTNGHNLFDELLTYPFEVGEKPTEPEPSHTSPVTTEELIEAAYWEFDARKKGLGEWTGAPQSERYAFKWVTRILLSKIGDKKIAEPSQKMCTLAGVSFPVPGEGSNSLEILARGFSIRQFTFSKPIDLSNCFNAICAALDQAIKEAK